MQRIKARTSQDKTVTSCLQLLGSIRPQSFPRDIDCPEIQVHVYLSMFYSNTFIKDHMCPVSNTVFLFFVLYFYRRNMDNIEQTIGHLYIHSDVIMSYK